MNISILGCGWLGLPLGQHLAGLGHNIKGSTTHEDKLEDLRKAEITPYHVVLDPELTSDTDPTFWNSEVLVLNIPPGRKRDDVESRHPQQVQAVIDQIEATDIEHVVYASSSSVYNHGTGVVKEEDAHQPERASGRALLKAEQMLNDHPGFATTVIRLGGLYGYGRHPVRYLAGRKGLKRGNAPVNLIHRDDAVQIFKRIITEKVYNTILNACSDGHPPRREFYTAASKFYKVEPPEFAEDDRRDYKVVSNRKLHETLQYQFMYPNPMDFTP